MVTLIELYSPGLEKDKFCKSNICLNRPVYLPKCQLCHRFSFELFWSLYKAPSQVVIWPGVKVT